MMKFKGCDVGEWVAQHLMLCILIICVSIGGVFGYTGYLIGKSSVDIPAIETSDVEVPWYVHKDADINEHIHLHNDVLVEYYDVLEGEGIVTVAIVNRTMSGKLYAESQTGIDSIGFEFDDRAVPLATNPGDVITIAGILSPDRRFGTTLKHCEIVGLGEIAKELKADADSQRIQLELRRPKEPIDSSELAEQLATICSNMTLMWPTVTQYMRG